MIASPVQHDPSAVLPKWIDAYRIGKAFSTISLLTVRSRHYNHCCLCRACNRPDWSKAVGIVQTSTDRGKWNDRFLCFSCYNLVLNQHGGRCKIGDRQVSIFRRLAELPRSKSTSEKATSTSSCKFKVDLAIELVNRSGGGLTAPELQSVLQQQQLQDRSFSDLEPKSLSGLIGYCADKEKLIADDSERSYRNHRRYYTPQQWEQKQQQHKEAAA